MESNDDLRHKKIESILGPCPVDKTDERYPSWVAIGQVVWTAQSQMKATMLAKAANAPLDKMPEVVIETIGHHYDLIAGLIAASVIDYATAAEAEQTLENAAEWVREWATTKIRQGPRTIREGVSPHDIRTCLRQRTAHWTVKVLELARRSTEGVERPIAAPTLPDKTTASDESRDTVTTVPFPYRGKWLQEQIDARGWTVHDVERNNGPHWRTVRKILGGMPVKETVLEKLAQALSHKAGTVRIGDIPRS